MRLDKALADRGQTKSRSRAQQLILGGSVTVNGSVCRKTAYEVSEQDQLTVEDSIGFVSRGGLKLEKAIHDFHISCTGLTALDIGASTGGFTQCLLRYGAAQVFAVDVGKLQMAEELRQDHRVTLLEETNARTISPSLFGGRADMAVMDVSFISQTLLYPALFPCVKETGPVIALVKPQFEAGSHALNKKGVVKDKAVFRTVLEHIQTAAREQGRGVADCILSPVRGGDGNIEFLVLLQTGAAIFEFEPLIRMVSM